MMRYIRDRQRSSMTAQQNNPRLVQLALRLKFRNAMDKEKSEFLNRSLLASTRRAWLSQNSMALVSTTMLQGRASAQSEHTEFIEIETTYGRVRGAKGAGLATFRGIPYAGSV